MSDNQSAWRVKSASGAIVPTRAATTSPQPDCRTCFWSEHSKKDGVVCVRTAAVLRCTDAVLRCTDADKYEPLPPVRLWRTAK